MTSIHSAHNGDILLSSPRSPHDIWPEYFSHPHQTIPQAITNHNQMAIRQNKIIKSAPATANKTVTETPEKSHVDDLLGIGFGPASLAIAIALHDAHGFSRKNAQQSLPLRVRFLEKQSMFRWHSGMLLPGAKMQISCVKDLATMRDPCSWFTFFNYLKQHDRLVQFANLGTTIPFRVEFEDYLRWCAAHFDSSVDYSREVLHVKPCKQNLDGKFDCFEVTSRDVNSGELTTHLSKKVVIAAGGQPSIPPVFRVDSPKVLHSSQYKHQIEKALPDHLAKYKVAIIGAGQSAAEIFHDLQSRYPNSTTRLMFRDTALRPSDDSPFVNEIFNPSAVDNFYRDQPQSRTKTIQSHRSTNYAVVQIGLLEQIYEDLYQQRFSEPDPSKQPHQILPGRETLKIVPSSDGGSIALTTKKKPTFADPASKIELDEVETQHFDALIFATGYTRRSHLDMLKQCQPLNANTGAEDGKSDQWRVSRNYKVELNRSMITDDVDIYLQGHNEATHGLSDSLLSILAVRSGEVVGDMKLVP